MDKLNSNITNSSLTVPAIENKNKSVGRYLFDRIFDCFRVISNFFTCGACKKSYFSDKSVRQFPRLSFKPFSQDSIKESLQSLKKNQVETPRTSYNAQVDRSRILISQKTLVPIGNESGHEHGFNANKLNINDVQLIATQHPLEQSKYLFWKMCIDMGSAIVDLPNPASCLNINLDTYYPERNKVISFGDITVRHMGSEQLTGAKNVQKSTYIISEDGKYKKQIERLHINLQSWPEHSAANLDGIIDLVNAIRAVGVEENSHPIIHCRTGVGRTAVMCTVLALVDPLLRGEIIHDNLLEELNHAILAGREQRSEKFVSDDDYTLLVRICEKILKNPQIILSVPQN